MVYDAVIAGGTFDRLHAGHRSFLDKGFSSGKKVLIGLTTEEMLRKTVRPGKIWPYEKRKEELEKYLEKFEKPFKIRPIDDIFGFATDLDNSYAIAATEETRPTCETINEKRRRKGLKELDIIMVPFLYSEDCRVISSSRIRKGEIDREGKILVDYEITERLREELKKPVGKIFEGENTFATESLISYVEEEKIDDIICVGDQVSRDLIESGFKPRNIIIDGRVMREPIDYEEILLKKYRREFNLKNSPGTISIQAWRVIRDALKEESAVFVDGEDDLLVFPSVLLSKNNTGVIYGQPGRGKVLVKVGDEKKEELRKRLSEFKTIRR